MAEDENSVEETNSGVKKKGDWKEISEFGEKVEEALKDSESVERFKEWRPKVEESEGDVKRKTVNEATLEEKKLEEKSNGVTEDLKNASEKVAEAGKKAADKELPDEELADASEEAAKPIYSKLAGFIRAIESKVYSWFALRFNPYSLDTEEFSVDIKDLNNGRFEMQVSVPEEDKRKNLKQSLEAE
ncbi:MAG: DUF5828 family protein [Candidatus Nanohaloarchaea archaeon]